MSTDNGNGTRASEKIEFLYEVRGRVMDLEALSAAFQPSLEMMPKPMVGKAWSEEEVKRARLALSRLGAMTSRVHKGLSRLLRYLDKESARREREPGEN